MKRCESILIPRLNRVCSYLIRAHKYVNALALGPLFDDKEVNRRHPLVIGEQARIGPEVHEHLGDHTAVRILTHAVDVKRRLIVAVRYVRVESLLEGVQEDLGDELLVVRVLHQEVEQWTLQLADHQVAEHVRDLVALAHFLLHVNVPM
jgi:hypothetical protein